VDALEVGRDFPLTRCGCGQRGCIENYLSGRGFAWLYEHFYHQKLEAIQIITLWEQGMRRRVNTSNAILICWRCVWGIF
jgi:N-acetylglucosamine kinase